LGGSPLQVLEILQEAAKNEIAVHIVKSQMVMNGTLQSTIIATVLGLAAQIEREFISVRTKEALAKRKAAGV
jgi:DNA invertase Pin-like site-specific DNA recombinase